MKTRMLFYILVLEFFCRNWCTYGQEFTKEIEVLFLPGLGSEKIEYSTELKDMEISFKKLYPDFRISIQQIPWEAGTSFWEYTQVRSRTQHISQLLCLKIEKLASDKQKSIVLCGHSLGGRVVVQTLSRLKQKKIQIRQAVLLGAAIPTTDLTIFDTEGSTHYPILNLIIEEDVVLKNCFPALENSAPALGSGIHIDCHILDIHTSVETPASAECHALHQYVRQLDTQAVWMSRLCN